MKKTLYAYHNLKDAKVFIGKEVEYWNQTELSWAKGRLVEILDRTPTPFMIVDSESKNIHSISVIITNTNGQINSSTDLNKEGHKWNVNTSRIMRILLTKSVFQWYLMYKTGKSKRVCYDVVNGLFQELPKIELPQEHLINTKACFLCDGFRHNVYSPLGCVDCIKWNTGSASHKEDLTDSYTSRCNRLGSPYSTWKAEPTIIHTKGVHDHLLLQYVEMFKKEPDFTIFR